MNKPSTLSASQRAAGLATAAVAITLVAVYLATGSMTGGRPGLVLGALLAFAALLWLSMRGVDAGSTAETATLQAELALLQAREFDYHSRLEAIGAVQCVVEYTPDGNIQHANAAFLASLGYAAGDLQGRSHGSLVDAGDRESGNWQRIIAGELRQELARRVGKDGRERWLQLIYVIVKDGAGRPAKVVEYGIDQTQQHQEAALNAAFKGALNKLSANVSVADPDGKIIYLNEAVRNMLHTAQSDFRKDLPNFDASRVLGANFDSFHKVRG